MGFERAQVKQSVKQTMKRTRPSPMLVTLLFTMVVSVVTGIINGVLGTLLTGGSGDFATLLLEQIERGVDIEDALEWAVMDMLRGGPGFIFGMIVGGTVLSIIISIWQAVMNVGYSGYCLSMVRGENPQIEKIFCAFPRIGAVLVTRILTGLFVFLWTLLFSVIYAVAVVVVVYVAVNIDVVALAVLFVLVFTVLYAVSTIWVTMRYELVDFALMDRDLSGMEAINESKRLMKGRIGSAFVLQLSFFGWYFLLSMIIYIGVFVAVALVVAPLILAQPAGYDGTGTAMAGTVISIILALVVFVASVIGTTVLSLWLQPYATGCMARFYDWAKASAGGYAMGPGGYGPNGYGPGGYGPGGYGPGNGYGPGGWGGPGVPGGPASGGPGGYSWTPGPGSTSGTGAGSGGSSAPQPPAPPKDDPWK